MSNWNEAGPLLQPYHRDLCIAMNYRSAGGLSLYMNLIQLYQEMKTPLVCNSHHMLIASHTWLINVGNSLDFP